MALIANTTNVVNNDRSFGLGTATPGSPATGMIRWNTSLTRFEVYNGTAWVAMITTGSATQPLYTWGENAGGSLGQNTATTSSTSSPASIVGGYTDWIKVNSSGSVGTLMMLALRADGTLWSWGYNGKGQLGDGTTSNRSSPVSVVGGFTDWNTIANDGSGTARCIAIRSNGTLWTWGENAGGALGDGTTSSRSSPVSVVGGFTDWVQCVTGPVHTAAIRANGTAWAWGDNSRRQLGDGTTSNRSSPVSVVGGFTDWVQVVVTNNSTSAIRKNGTAWSWGQGTLIGLLGDGNPSTIAASPISVVGGFTDWVQLSSGSSQSITGLRANGTIWGWARNSAGQLADGTTTNRFSPVSAVGGFTDWVFVCASGGIRSNGTAWGWGYNTRGQLGDGTTSNRSSPVSVVGGFTDWVVINKTTNAAAIRAI